MDSHWRRTFLAHSTLPAYLARVDEAGSLIRAALASHRRPYVAFSGGKDSTVMLALCVEAMPDIEVFNWDYDATLMPRPMQARILENARSLGAQSIRVATSTKYNDPKHKEVSVFGVDFFRVEVPRMLAEGFDLAFVGLRSDESLNRKRRIKAGRSLTRLAECWPLQAWSWLDIWAFIVSRKLPYLSEFYDERAPVMGWDKVRFVTFFDRQFAHLGSTNIDGFFAWRMRHGTYNP